MFTSASCFNPRIQGQQIGLCTYPAYHIDYIAYIYGTLSELLHMRSRDRDRTIGFVHIMDCLLNDLIPLLRLL
ncbi:hypothetical protein D3C81_2024480 [compost metagenome]